MAKVKHEADEDLVAETEANRMFVEEFCVKPTFDEDGVQATAGIGHDGKEYGDPVPMSPPIGYERPPDMMEMMRNMLRQEAYQRRLAEEGLDTFEEAGDFDIDDDPMPLTIHEALLVDPPPAAPEAPPAPNVPQTTDGRQGGQGGGSPEPAPAAPPTGVPPAVPDKR